jgi:hypothetical protein
MKAILATALIAMSAAPVLASETNTYTTKCIVTINRIPEPQVCQVVENRNSQGFLNWRNVYARNYYVNSWFDNSGFVTKDSTRKKPYKWQYRATGQGYSKVSPELNVFDVSWD